jgi:hypothetical protein
MARIPTAAAILCTCVLLLGCGGTGGSHVPISVGGKAITDEVIDHWARNLAVRNFALLPTGQIPAWVTSAPPSFDACVKHEEATAPGLRPAALKRCKARYDAVRRQAAEFLISCDWIVGEAKALGVTAPTAKVEARLRRVIKSEYGDRAHFDRYLQISGESLTDYLFRQRVKVYSEGIEELFRSRPGSSLKQQQLAFEKWAVAFPVRWAARTQCERGFVSPNCRNYKGPHQPEVRL